VARIEDVVSGKRKRRGKSKPGPLTHRAQRQVRQAASRPELAHPAQPSVRGALPTRAASSATEPRDARGSAAGATEATQAKPNVKEAANVNVAEEILAADAVEARDAASPAPSGSRAGRRSGRERLKALVRENEEPETPGAAALDQRDEDDTDTPEPRAMPAATAQDGDPSDTSPESAAVPSAPQPVTPRAMRRPKTLADVVQPQRAPIPRGDEPPLRRPALTRPLTERLSDLDPADDTPTLTRWNTPGARRDATGGRMEDTRPRGRPARETRPIAASEMAAANRARQGWPRRAPDEAEPETGPSARHPSGGRGPARLDDLARELGQRPRARPLPNATRPLSEGIPARFIRAAQRGDASLMKRVAMGHAVAGFVAAVTASALVLAGNTLGIWLLGFTALAVPGAVLAYTLLSGKRVIRAGGLLLVITQIAALAWACALVGPRGALLVMAPAGVWLALRFGGRIAAALYALGNVGAYLTFLVLVATGVYYPLVSLDTLGQSLVDGTIATLGVGLLVIALLATAGERERTEAASRARLYELRLLRAELARAREDTEHDAAALHETLTRALRGRGIDPVTARGALSPVAEGINAVAERLATLQKDREDRLRLEGALRSLIRSIERGWLGLTSSWPQASGTMLDELVAVLRARRAQEVRVQQAERAWTEEIPTFLTLPTVEMGPRSPLPRSHPGTSHPGDPAPWIGWDDLLDK
jgi:hypothetical protein